MWQPTRCPRKARQTHHESKQREKRHWNSLDMSLNRKWPKLAAKLISLRLGESSMVNRYSKTKRTSTNKATTWSALAQGPRSRIKYRNWMQSTTSTQTNLRKLSRCSSEAPLIMENILIYLLRSCMNID